MDGRFGMVLVAGLSPLATLGAAEALPASGVTVARCFPARGKAFDVIPVAPELTRELP